MRRFFKRKKKDEGPFKANRILNTQEIKVDQVFTKTDEKPVALFTTITEDEARKIVMTWFETPFSEKDSHKRRLQKIYRIEKATFRETGGNS